MIKKILTIKKNLVDDDGRMKISTENVLVAYPSFEEFKMLMNSIMTVEEKYEKLYSVLDDICIDSTLFLPNSSNAVLEYLTGAFEDKENEWLYYYACDLRYGKDWKPGCCTGADGNDIKLQTLEDIYKFLEKNLLEKATK